MTAGQLERVLIVRVGAMGDVLHALPAMAALRARQPELAIDWVVDPRWAPLLADEAGVGPVVSRVHLAETKLWSQAPLSAATRHSVLALRAALRDAGRGLRYDAAIDMQGTLRSAVLGSFAGAKTFAGYADPRERAARWFYRQPQTRRGIHVVEQGAALLGEALGFVLHPAHSVPLPMKVKEESWAEQAVATCGNGRPIVLLAPTAGWEAKQWPAERFGALARRLRERGFAVMVNAVHDDDAVAMAVVRGSGGAATVMACSVGQLVALTRRVALVVGGDSGPVHLAAALGVPVVALYGPTDPARNGPWGAGMICALRDAASVTNHHRRAAVDSGLLRIGVETVMEAALALLEP